MIDRTIGPNSSSMISANARFTGLPHVAEKNTPRRMDVAGKPWLYDELRANGYGSGIHEAASPFSYQKGVHSIGWIMKSLHFSTPTQPTLTPDALNGDLDAFNHLVLEYQDLVFDQAFAILGDRHSAQDATQECFIKAFQHLSGFRGGSFRAWLLRIVINTSYDEIRHSSRHPTTPLLPVDENDDELESPAWLLDPNGCVQDIVEQKESFRDLQCLLFELPEIYRHPIALIDLHDLGYSEAAKLLEIPIGTVKSRLARARVQMKTKLQCSLELPGRSNATGARQMS